MKNTFARSVTQKLAATTLLGGFFAVLTPIVTIANAFSGMKPFYTQTRYGQDGKPFQVYKFKSMHDGDAPDSERVTAVGKFLRKTSMDEIPQLINVLKGDMDLVGWRPLNKPYSGVLERHMRSRLPDASMVDASTIDAQKAAFDSVRAYIQLSQSVKPGITGSAQISKHRGNIESGNFNEFAQITKMDAEYAAQREGSMLSAAWRDAVIIAKTPYALMKYRGHVARDHEPQNLHHDI